MTSYHCLKLSSFVIIPGTFGFKYRTEDGISHAAQGDPTGFIQGSYSYKDPTGLKVNFNYFAGARNNQSPAPQQQYQEPQYTPAPSPPVPQEYYRYNFIYNIFFLI